MATQTKSDKPGTQEAGEAERRALGLLLEGAAKGLPQIDLAAHRRFRSAILRPSISLGKPQSETELLHGVGEIVREFDTFRSESEATLELRLKEWRHLVSMLMQQLAVRDEIDVKSGMWAEVHKNLVSAIAAGDVAALRARLLGLFEHTQEETAARNLARHEEVDRSMANDNAAGLRGGGAAIQHVREMLASGRPGYVCLFHMSCLDVVGERFGAEGIQDCLMAVSAFLTQNMRVEDTVYHWSESSLLAICDRKVRQDILTAELNRMLSRNRDFTIKIGDRTIMLRIPVDLHLDPISHFASADELHRLTMERPQIDRALVR